MAHYSRYQADDFLHDPSFQNWVLRPDAELESYWQNVWDLYPDKRSEMRKAKEALMQVRREWHEPSEQLIEEDWLRLRQSIDKQDTGGGADKWYQRPFFRVAASIIFFAGLAFSLWYQFGQDERLSYTTTFGETRLVSLPDGSTARLNANSSLTFEPAWQPGQPREVWLQGEAFFEVDKISSGGVKQQFIVHTAELAVEVLGTVFNVNSRGERTQVTLNSGKVVVKKEDTRSIEMEPGEQLELNHRSRQLTLRQVNTRNFTSWNDDRLAFENMPVNEILSMLHDRYGWEFELVGTDLKDKRYTGSVSVEQPAMLLDKLSLLYGLQLKRSGKQITIQNAQQ